jgi:hypothetical protein
MSDMDKPMAAAMLAMAQTALGSNERLTYLQSALKLDPNNSKISAAIVAIKSNVDDSVCYVAIERAVIIGESPAEIEGGIYILQPDRSLKPLSGAELLAFNKQQPNFVKNWRLKRD